MHSKFSKRPVFKNMIEKSQGAKTFAVLLKSVDLSSIPRIHGGGRAQMLTGPGRLMSLCVPVGAYVCLWEPVCTCGSLSVQV